MRSPIISAISAALISTVAAACADIAPTAVQESVIPSVSSNFAVVTEVGFSGNCETTFAPPPFPLPPQIQQTDRGSCRIAHLGHASFYAQQEISFATGTATSSDVRFTAANGDVLTATSAGTFAPSGPGVSIDAVFIFTGGTGRFEGARGSGTIRGQVDFSTNTTTFEFTDGRLSYSPADRRN
jgi:hypothetical protein